MRITSPGGNLDFNENPDDRDHYEQFLGLFSRDRDRIFSHVFSLIPHEADAEDVFQRCSVILWRKFGEFDPAGNFLAWACGIALNEVRNFLKTRRRSRIVFFPESIELLSAEKLSKEEQFSARRAALEDCIGHLRPAEQNLIRIAYWEQQSLKEFAEATGGSLQVLYNRLSRIRKSLFNCIERKLSREPGYE